LEVSFLHNPTVNHFQNAKNYQFYRPETAEHHTTLEVSTLHLLLPKIAGSNPAEAVVFFRA
jgi:hypothetical protein